MSFKNPLDRIKKMNAENEVKKSQEEALEKEQKIQSQENTDTQYELVSDQKQGYSEQVIQFKERIADITGTQEEMIAEYRKTINEAKKDPETLKYVKDNFDEIFAGAKKQWKDAGSEKIDAIESQKGFEESITELDSQLEELYPKTTTGKEELAEKELEALKNELADIELTDTIKNKWQILRESKWQEENLENFLNDKNELLDEYTSLVEEYSNLKSSGAYTLPEFENLRLTKFDSIYSEIDLKEGFEKARSNVFYSEIDKLKLEIRNVENTFLKRGLKKLVSEKENLEIEQQEIHKVYLKLDSIKNSIQKKLTAIFEKNNIQDLYKTTEVIGNPSIGIMFKEIEKDKAMTQEQRSLLERHKELENKLKDLQAESK